MLLLLDYMQKRISVIENPRSTGHALSGPLGGLWRYRIEIYRVICDVQDNALRVLVVRLGKRSDIYSSED